MMHWWNGWGSGYGMGYGFGWLFMILFWALVILGIVYLVKMLAGHASKPEQKETAEEILKKRFARGELGREEFEKAMQVLRQERE
jgi:putative membrane protein